MRNTCDSSNTACTVSLSFLDDSRSVPNGFSMITRECSLARPDEPSIVTTEPNATGGTARWNSRPIACDPFRLRPLEAAPAIAFSASSTAVTSGAGSSGEAAPKESREANESHDPSGLQLPNSWQACSARARKSSSEIANSAGDEPMTRNSSGSSPATNRW